MHAKSDSSSSVGHTDFKYLRFQCIGVYLVAALPACQSINPLLTIDLDTPGILDRPLEEMNTIEMQSITAIAHLRAAILYCWCFCVFPLIISLL